METAKCFNAGRTNEFLSDGDGMPVSHVPGNITRTIRQATKIRVGNIPRSKKVLRSEKTK